MTRAISIHAPRTGSDMAKRGESRGRHAFQSTLPARGATDAAREADEIARISIHAPRTGSDWGENPSALFAYISIHAPRTGSDLAQGYQINPGTIFQSTLPARGAT